MLLSLSVAHSKEKGFRVGLILDKGGKDDRSFNSAAYQGLMRAKKELKVYVKFVEAIDDNAFEPLLRAFATRGYNLIISIGVSQTEAVKKVAFKFPQQYFAIVDGKVDAPNVRSLLFQENEGSFLVGAIAAMSSKTNVIGFIGGMDIPLIRRFELGYIEGAKYIKKNIKVISNFIGVSADAWNNPAKAKELAVSQYDNKADVIFAAAGASGAGLFDAAEENGKLAIGVDSNQDWVKPGFILTSMIKKVEEVVFSVISDTFKGHFTGGTYLYGLKNRGVDYSFDQFNKHRLTPEHRKKAEEIKADIISGKIQVPDYYKTRK